MASGSSRCLYFLLDDWVHGGRLRGERFLTALNDFWLQYLLSIWQCAGMLLGKVMGRSPIAAADSGWRIQHCFGGSGQRPGVDGRAQNVTGERVDDHHR